MKKTFILEIIFVATLTVLLGGTTGNPAFADSMYVFTHKTVPDNSLSQAELKNIFLGKKVRWADNQPIDCVTLSDRVCQEEFVTTYVKKTTFQFNNYWKKQIFTGKGQPPRTFDSQQDLIDYVARTSGAVGFSCTRPDTSRVNVIQIN